ncbi:MAG: RNA polymerase sigma factor, partial [Planctomycetales bacterium]|nr:RNA polymerase sigma factor [Planctomycetales bacterium]
MALTDKQHVADDIQQPSDGTLIAEVLTGRRERFAVLVDRYQAPLIRVARSRLGRHDWAEDVVQETFLCAFKSLASYNSQYSFRTWLWTILLNQCRRHVQKRSRRPLVRSWSDQPASA